MFVGSTVRAVVKRGIGTAEGAVNNRRSEGIKRKIEVVSEVLVSKSIAAFHSLEIAAIIVTGNLLILVLLPKPDWQRQKGSKVNGTKNSYFQSYRLAT